MAPEPGKLLPADLLAAISALLDTKDRYFSSITMLLMCAWSRGYSKCRACSFNLVHRLHNCQGADTDSSSPARSQGRHSSCMQRMVCVALQQLPQHLGGRQHRWHGTAGAPCCTGLDAWLARRATGLRQLQLIDNEIADDERTATWSCSNADEVPRTQPAALPAVR